MIDFFCLEARWVRRASRRIGALRLEQVDAELRPGFELVAAVGFERLDRDKTRLGDLPVWHSYLKF